MQLTLREAARFLNVSAREVYRWADAGEIPRYRVNDQYRFNAAELLEWATARNLTVSADLLPKEAGEQPFPTLAEALQAGGISHGLAGTDRNSVLRAMVDGLRLPDRSDADALYEILIAREKLGTTGIGNGIAIPHVRHPIVVPTTGCSVTLWFLEHPIPFGAPDGKPVRALFWILSPTIRAHMQMLSRLASVLQDPGFLELIERQAPAARILDEARRVEQARNRAAGGER